MSQSLSQIYVHMIFGTKNRENLIKKDDLPKVFNYIGGIIHNIGGGRCEVGGTSNHIHILSSLPKTLSAAKLLEKIKSSSSKWIKQVDPYYLNFSWQSGYGIFSVSSSNYSQVEKYIQEQETHHKKLTFAEEYIQFLDAYEVEYDEKYLWD